MYIITVRLANKSFLGERISLRNSFWVKSVNNVAEESLRPILSVMSSSIFVSKVRMAGPLKVPRTVKSADPVCFWCNRPPSTMRSDDIVAYACNFSHARRRNPSARWKMIGSTWDKVFARRDIYTGCFEYVWITASRIWYELALFLRREKIDSGRERSEFLFKRYILNFKMK